MNNGRVVFESLSVDLTPEQLVVIGIHAVLGYASDQAVEYSFRGQRQAANALRDIVYDVADALRKNDLVVSNEEICKAQRALRELVEGG